MKHYYLFLLTLITFSGWAQVPANYYNSANGLQGYALKSELHSIISTGYQQHSYDDLYDGYETTDVDNYYEMDGSVLDIYSERPTASDAYNYQHTSSDQCGNYNSEADCYNREHIIPQSVFNEASPMVSDIHQVIPTDGYVNNRRSNYPFAKVNSPNWTSTNGSKVGSSSTPGYSGNAFEPIDEFKGDIARAVLYFAVRYEGQVGNWSFAMFDGSNDKVFTDWALDLLLAWHAADPVSQREIDRNNAAYNYQNNANPFVSHPEYAQMIWNPTPDTTAPSVPTNLMVTNEASTSISLSWTASTDNIGVTSYDIYVDGNYNSSSTTTTATVVNLTPETTYTFTVVAKDAANNISSQSAPVDGTTTAAGSSGSECASETFTNIQTSSSSYTSVSWTGDNGSLWNATDARTDQTITGKAITIRDGVLTAPTFAGGIGTFTVKTKRVFGGSSGTFNLKVNGNVVGTIAYSDQDVTQTITIPDINIENNVTISIDGNSTASNRVVFDDLSWTCYSSLGVDEQSLSTVNVYPNPAKNIVNITLNNDSETLIEIYNVLGKKVYQKTIQNSDILNLDTLSSGIYIVKLTQGNNSISKKLIKN